MNQTAQREQIHDAVASLVGREVTDIEIENLAQTAPALFHLLRQKAQGLLSNPKTVTDKFLRTLPEALLDWTIVLALGFLRRGHEQDIEALLRSELYCLATRLYLCERERELDDYYGRDEEALTMMQRLAQLILLEEQRRAGAFAWIGPYRLSARVTDEFPPRLPARDRSTEH